MNYKRFFLALFIIALTGLAGCKAYKPAVIPVPVPVSVSNSTPAGAYISKYKDLAINEMARTGVPASITLAQGMLESDFGRSRLAREANNHFGIKCHSGWSGQTVHHNDDTKNECFRKYTSAEQSFIDHSDFLRGTRYKSLFLIEPTDYKAWAHGLKKCGYATNPDYANLLIRKIEENGLNRYDFRGKEVKDIKKNNLAAAQKPPLVKNSEIEITQPVTGSLTVSARPMRVSENNKVQYIIVRDGDTMEKIEEDFQLLRWEIMRYNDLKGKFRLVPGDILYLEPKKDKAEEGKEYHICVKGETMHMISQKYAIRLKSLYELNGMKEGKEPAAGQQLSLRLITEANRR